MACPSVEPRTGRRYKRERHRRGHLWSTDRQGLVFATFSSRHIRFSIPLGYWLNRCRRRASDDRRSAAAIALKKNGPARVATRPGPAHKEETMDKTKVARLDPAGALGRARAAWALLDILHDGEDYLQIPFMKMTEREKATLREWMRLIASDALEQALDELEKVVA